MNFRILIFFSFCLFSVKILLAQDIILFKNGIEAEVKVKEVNPEHIKYVRFDNPAGPIYTVYRSEVFMIKYENGSKDVITDLSISGKSGRKNFGTDYRSPGLAFLFSFLLPGGGQYYNKEYVKGGIMTGLWFAGMITSAIGASQDITCYDHPNSNSFTCTHDDDPNPAIAVGGTVMFGTWLWSVIDAPVRASRNNKGLKATGLLEFENDDKFSLKIHPFNGNGLGGNVTMNF